MLLAITTTYHPATDLGYLLAKNPARCQSFPLAFGQAHVFYPVARDDCCTAVLLMDLDPVGLVRTMRARPSHRAPLQQYVNDRPYVASSFLSVAIARIFGSAMKGTCRERTQLAEAAIPLTAELPVLPCRGGEPLLRRLFEPLGYAVEARRLPLDENFPEWGDSSYYAVTLRATCRLQDLLTHLYVLLPVLDNDKHYWIGEDELNKLLAKGTGWLASHPEKQRIVERYLRFRPPLVREAFARLVAEEAPDIEASEQAAASEERLLEQPLRLNEQRIGAVIAALRAAGARRVIDAGCGEGRLLRALLDDSSFERVAGMDVSYRALQVAEKRLKLDRLPAGKRNRIELFQGSLTYRDGRLAGYDAMCITEVIEHFDPWQIAAFERVVFEFTQPTTVIITTPNKAYNVRFDSLPESGLRHRDHRFEWTCNEFQTWAWSICDRYGYSVRFVPVGRVAEAVGPPTQMGVFTR